MSIFTEVSTINTLEDADIAKSLDLTTSTAEKNIMIVGKDKYLHTVYALKKLPVFTDDEVLEQKIFTIFSDITVPANIYLNFLDTDMSVAQYEIIIKTSKHRYYDDIETVYVVDDVDINVLKSGPDPANWKLRAYGTWGFGENMEYLLHGVRYINTDDVAQHFSMRLITSHYPFHYGPIDILGLRPCTMFTSQPLCSLPRAYF